MAQIKRNNGIKWYPKTELDLNDTRLGRGPPRARPYRVCFCERNDGAPRLKRVVSRRRQEESARAALHFQRDWNITLGPRALWRGREIRYRHVLRPCRYYTSYYDILFARKRHSPRTGGRAGQATTVIISGSDAAQQTSAF